jgi:hypothetical protein
MDKETVDAVKEVILDELKAKPQGQPLLLNSIYPKLEKINDVTRVTHKALDDLIDEGAIQVREGMTLWQARISNRQE